MRFKPVLLVKNSYSSLIVGVFALLVVSVSVCPAFAQVQAFPNTSSAQVTTHTVRQKAQPDECWAYLANPSPLPKFTDPANCSSYPMPPGMPPAKPKVNQSYIWGITESGDELWWGTFANGNCVTQAGSVPSTGNPNGSPNAHASDAWVCEYYDSPYYPSPIGDARIGDFRPPKTYQYIKSTQTLIDKTPRYSFYSGVNNPEGIHLLLYTTRGIRAAVTINGLIILAGPSLDPSRGLNFFAWDAGTGEFLGARTVPGYNNIRQFLVLDGVAYTAVGKNDCPNGICTPTVTGGRILRLDPSVIQNCSAAPVQGNPFPACFLLNGGTLEGPLPPEEVGNLDTVAGALTIHNGRIYTVTWPHQDLPGKIASLYQSPVVPSTGLRAAHANQWTQRWKANNYEPDPNMAQFYAGGALASYDGYLWWGTLHIPMQPFMYLFRTYPPRTRQEALQDLAGSFRATVFFRGKELDTDNPQIDLVYGNERLPVFTPPSGLTPQSWKLQSNNMKNPKSLWGPSGFGNPWNTYTWSAAVWDNRLWIGTMDWSLNAQQGSVLMRSGGLPVPPELFSAAKFGGDLFYFTSANKPAFPESSDGVDNPTSFGIRNQRSSNNGNLFLGMANASNLLTDPTDPKDFGGLGGWELIELSESNNLNTPVGQNVIANLQNGVSVDYCSVSNEGTTFSTIVKNPFAFGLPVHPLLAPYGLGGPELPAGLAKAPTDIVMLWTSALWGQGCSTPALAKVTVPIPGDMALARLLQLQWNGVAYEWRDVTTSANYVTRKISGTLSTDFLGILGVAQVAVPSLSGTITSQGMDTRGNYYVDVTLSNTSRGVAVAISTNSLVFRTLAGSGIVSYNSQLSPPLPWSIGNVAPEAKSTIRLYLKSTTTFGNGGVTKFAVAGSLRFNDSFGNNYAGSFNQEASVPLNLVPVPPPTTAETIPPSIPANITVGCSPYESYWACRAQWTASTDTGGSGLKGYLVDLYGNSYGTVRLDGPVSQTFAEFYTSELDRVSVYAVDNAGNVSQPGVWYRQPN